MTSRHHKDDRHRNDRCHGRHHDKCHGSGVRTVLATKENIKTLIELIKAKFDEVIRNVTHLSFHVVTELPPVGEPNIIYLVPSYGSEIDYYDEYYWVVDESRFELLGSGRQFVVETDETVELEYQSSIKPNLKKVVTIIKTGE